MTYYELLENYLYEKATSEFYDEKQLDTLVEEGFVISHEPDTYDYTLIKSLSESKIVVKYEGEYSSPEFMILNGSRDVTHKEVGSIADIDEFLAKDYLAELAAEKERTSKLITVGSLEKILDKYDSEKGISTKNGAVMINDRQIAFYSDVSSVRSSLNSLQSSVNTTLNKKAEKTHTHKAADITDMPNFVKTVNGENPDTDGNINIDADSVVEVTELPAEAEKKVYLKPEVAAVQTAVDCTSGDSIISDLIYWLTGERRTFENPVKLFLFLRDEFTKTNRGTVIKNAWNKYETYSITLNPIESISINGNSYNKLEFGWAKKIIAYLNTGKSSIGSNIFDEYSSMYRVSCGSEDIMRWLTVPSEKENNNVTWFETGWGKLTSITSTGYTYSPELPDSITLETAKVPSQITVKGVQLATKEDIAGLATAQDDIKTLKTDTSSLQSSVSTLTSGQAAVEKSVSDLQTDLQAKIDAINAILTKNNLS